MHQNGSRPTDKGDFQARPRPVPPPGAIASASLPGYRRAGVGAGAGGAPPPPPPPPPLLLPLHTPPAAPAPPSLQPLQPFAWRSPRASVSLTYAESTLASPLARVSACGAGPASL